MKLIKFDNDGITKYFNGSLIMAIAGSTYLLTNHLHFFEPVYLPLTWVDTTFPFVAASIWIYLSYFLIFISAFVLQQNLIILTRYLLGVIFLNLSSCAIFVLYPTTFDRTEILERLSVNEFSKSGFDLIYLFDSPANCFPSLHVSIAFFSAFMLSNKHRALYFMFIIWAILISLSTLTTKQHYFVDILGGLITAFIAYWLFFIKNVLIDEEDSRSAAR